MFGRKKIPTCPGCGLPANPIPAARGMCDSCLTSRCGSMAEAALRSLLQQALVTWEESDAARRVDDAEEKKILAKVWQDLAPQGFKPADGGMPEFAMDAVRALRQLSYNQNEAQGAVKAILAREPGLSTTEEVLQMFWQKKAV